MDPSKPLIELPTLPVLDEELHRQVIGFAGQAIHEVTAEAGIYLNSVVGSHRLAQIITENGVRNGDLDELKRRIAVSEEYRRLLQTRVNRARQEKADAGGLCAPQ